MILKIFIASKNAGNRHMRSTKSSRWGVPVVYFTVNWTITPILFCQFQKNDLKENITTAKRKLQQKN